MTELRHFLNIRDQSSDDLRSMLDSAKAMKAGTPPRAGAGKTLAMIFEKPSTRTRVSFEVAIQQMGGSAVILGGNDSQLGRGETIADTARVLSRYADVIMIRTNASSKLTELADNATVPVINGLTDACHPCQIMADVLTFEEHRGDIKDAVVAWCGDGNNVLTSWIEASAKFGFEVRAACPDALKPKPDVLAWATANNARLTLTSDPKQAVDGANCVVTDTWVSMGDEEGDRKDLLGPFQVTTELMSHAETDALFMHCLPAHRGDEMTAEVIDGPQSVVWDEAENRLHAQKGILEWCLNGA